MEPENHHDAESLARVRLRQAQLRYDCAKQLVVTLRSRGVTDSVLEYAIAEQSRAFDEYRRCLGVFADLVMRDGG